MSRAIEQWRIDSLTKAQADDIEQRKKFLGFNALTQQAIFQTISQMAEMLDKDNSSEQETLDYFLRTVRYHEKNDPFVFDDDIDYPDWYEVDSYIRAACLRDSDMSCLELVPKRVFQELVICASLIEIQSSKKEF